MVAVSFYPTKLYDWDLTLIPIFNIVTVPSPSLDPNNELMSFVLILTYTKFLDDNALCFSSDFM